MPTGNPRAWWQAVSYWTREFFGENDYARYIADWQERHGGDPGSHAHQPMSERKFFAYRVGVRYDTVSPRC